MRSTRGFSFCIFRVYIKASVQLSIPHINHTSKLSIRNIPDAVKPRRLLALIVQVVAMA
jgi:hypothetical protein